MKVGQVDGFDKLDGAFLKCCIAKDFFQQIKYGWNKYLENFKRTL